MSVKRLFAIGFIFMCAAAAWMILGCVTLTRTERSEQILEQEVRTLFGGHLKINAPMMYTKKVHITKIFNEKGEQIEKMTQSKQYIKLESSDIQVKVNLDPRKKGVLWFPTFRATYGGRYVFDVSADSSESMYLYATLESSDAVYDNISLRVNGREIIDISPLIKKRAIPVRKDEQGKVHVFLRYETTGMEEFHYYISPSPEDVEEINNFSMSLTTDFRGIDFPPSTISPTLKSKTPEGWELLWSFKRSITGKDIGLIIPSKLNPGHIVSRVTFFAPVSLLFYLVAIIVISLMMNIRIHPMNYFFISAAFFSFHLVYSYFSDHINIYITFAIASGISLVLSSTYLRIFTAVRFSFVYSALAQFIYLVIFSFSFFFKGLTGLIVTVASVVTLFVLMQATGRLDWEEVFNRGSGDSPKKKGLSPSC